MRASYEGRTIFIPTEVRKLTEDAYGFPAGTKYIVHEDGSREMLVDKRWYSVGFTGICSHRDEKKEGFLNEILPYVKAHLGDQFSVDQLPEPDQCHVHPVRYERDMIIICQKIRECRDQIIPPEHDLSTSWLNTHS